MMLPPSPGPACCSASSPSTSSTAAPPRAGARWGWATVVVVRGLSAFGVSLGRFERWNSWDLFAQPLSLLADVLDRVFNPIAYPRTTGVTLLFASFLLLGYLALVALMRVHRNETVGGANTTPAA